MVLYIKNMMCIRCTMLVKMILKDMKLEYVSVDLGIVELVHPVTEVQKDKMKEILKLWDLALIEDHNEILVEKIKHLVINMIHNNVAISSIKTSYYLSQYLGYNYTYLANVFSQLMGISLRDFIISKKIEKAKTMMFEGLTVTEIAWRLNYSSVAHLSNQFTKVTGFSPSQFKKNSGKNAIPLEQICMLEAV